MDVSDCDWRQYHRMRRKIADFEHGDIAIHHLIADLKGLMAALEKPEADWMEAFHDQWACLEENYAVALMKKLQWPTASDQAVRNALTAMTRLLAAIPEHRFTCPCCGHIVFDEPPGSYEICPICFWEDDDVQLRHPTMSGGANKPSLVAAQASFQAIGAIEARFIELVRRPGQGEPRDPQWRPVDAETDRFPGLASEDKSGSGGRVESYYWRRR
jgi:Cysteine-rich CPCC